MLRFQEWAQRNKQIARGQDAYGASVPKGTN
jgi:hypothetical protein